MAAYFLAISTSTAQPASAPCAACLRPISAAGIVAIARRFGSMGCLPLQLRLSEPRPPQRVNISLWINSSGRKRCGEIACVAKRGPGLNPGRTGEGLRGIDRPGSISPPSQSGHSSIALMAFLPRMAPLAPSVSASADRLRSPARGEVLIEFFERLAFQLHDATPSPLRGGLGRG
jgi:hypothetical protein